MAGYLGPEKRKYYRFDASYLLSYKLKRGAETYNVSQTKNFSQGGAIIITDELFPVGAHMEIILQFPFISGKLTVVCEIVDVKETAKDLLYETRVRFIDLPQECFIKIGEFIDAHRKAV